jgi:hypothetical protein
MGLNLMKNIYFDYISPRIFVKPLCGLGSLLMHLTIGVAYGYSHLSTSGGLCNSDLKTLSNY